MRPKIAETIQLTNDLAHPGFLHSQWTGTKVFW